MRRQFLAVLTLGSMLGVSQCVAGENPFSDVEHTADSRSSTHKSKVPPNETQYRGGATNVRYARKVKVYNCRRGKNWRTFFAVFGGVLAAQEVSKMIDYFQIGQKILDFFYPKKPPRESYS